jgi:mono/diheme cytochrome c family protein
MRDHYLIPKFLMWGLILCGVVFFSFSASHGQAQHPSTESTRSGNVARGKYLVEGVAMCGTCHTPRTDNGELERDHWLEGASLWLQPSRPDSNWPLKAPRISGNPAGTDAELITLLTTGVWKGSHLRPPMPQFRMSREDAESVVAYLRSLSGGSLSGTPAGNSGK